MEVATFLENVDWNPVPVHKAARNVELVRCQPHKPVYGWLISDQVTEMYVHWDGHDSSPHLKDRDKCWGCKQKLGLRRKGYLAILLRGDPVIRIVEILDQCLKECVLFHGKSHHLRGRLVTIKRRASKKDGKEHKRSPVEAVWGEWPAPKDLPADFDIRPTLGLIFGVIPDLRGNTRYPGDKEGDA